LKLKEELGLSSQRDMGKMMAELKSRHAGKIDMSKVSKLVKEILS
jgi:uncharacterized protein YqeY